jgi:hypothetical protein
VSSSEEATNENRHKATEARHGGIEGDFGQAGLRSGRQTLDAVTLDRGRLVAESVMRIKRAEISGPDYFPSDPLLQTVPGQAPSGRRGVPLCRDCQILAARETEYAEPQFASRRKAA